MMRDQSAQARAADAACHRANAEAFLELAELRAKPQYVEMAHREYQKARDLEDEAAHSPIHFHEVSVTPEGCATFVRRVPCNEMHP